MLCRAARGRPKNGKDRMTHKAFIALVLAGGLSCTAVSALAQGPRGPMPSFSELDANGDGELTQDEMTAHRTAQFNELDSNGDGVLSTDELEARIAARAGKMVERLDANSDGVIGQEELQARRGGAGTRMFNRIDADNNGTISEEEFALAQDRARDRMRKNRTSN